jgi:hypothetical protein
LYAICTMLYSYYNPWLPWQEPERVLTETEKDDF